MTQEIAIQTPAQGNGMMAVIERAAADPGIDAAKMMALLDVHERILNKQAEAAFNSAKLRMKADLPKIGKNKENSQTSSRYCNLEKIKDMVDPVLSQHGFDVSYENYFPSVDRVGVTCVLVHELGHKQKNSVELPLDNKGIKGMTNKTDVHAAAASITYAQRYALCGVLGITTGEKDGNSINDEFAIIENDQAVEIDLLIRETKSDKERFLKWIEADSVQTILAKNYDKAMKMLNEKKVQK